MNKELDIVLTTNLQQLVSPEIAYHYGVIPKEETQGSLVLYIKERSASQFSEEELELIIGKSVQLEPIKDSIVEKALSQYYRTGGTKASNSNFELGNDFLESLIWDAKSVGSSDIHFELFKDSARIRLRIDGKLIERYTVDIEDYAELVNKVKIRSNLNITEKRLPQDGRISFDDFDIRVSILPTHYGEKIVMRILGRDTSNLSIEKLGMEEAERIMYNKAVRNTKGIVLISGPTGSGKTTTLYATLKVLNKISDNIITAEDPIEYTLEGINQVQVRDEIGLTFARALKTFLRQDPDIIMLGEIRDEQTAQMAIRASLTGHLVLSTIHTNSALGTLSRLMDMGVPPFLIAETLNISVAQRLVRVLCESCKECSPAEKEIKELYPHIQETYKPIGCNDCFHTGYKGRVAIYEMIDMTPEIKQIVKSGKINKETEQIKYEKLSDKALGLVEKGITTYEEVYSILIEQ